MDILYAAAAFAVLMIVFSTAVTGLTESYLRITSIRAKVLSRSVLQFLRTDPTVQRFTKQVTKAAVPAWVEEKVKNVDLDTTLKGVDRLILLAGFEEQAKTAKGDAKPAAEKALESAQAKLTVPKGSNSKNAGDIGQPVNDADSLPTLLAYNGLTENQSLNASYGFPHAMLTWLRNKLTGVTEYKDDVKRVEKLSTYSFLQRLAQTDIGKEIAKSGEEAALRSLTMGFERYIAASNEVFRKHAQATTMILSILFAFAVNVDAFRVFNHLADNPQLSQALVEKGDEYGEENQAAVAALNERLNGLEQKVSVAEPNSEDVNASLKEVKAAITEAREIALNATNVRNEVIEAQDLPIGWDHYPFGGENALCFLNEKVNCTIETVLASANFLVWLVGTLLAGFLIGLGGPFWYKVFSGLSALLQIVRGLQGGARKEAIEAETPDEQPASQKLVDVVAGGADIKDGDLMKMFQDSTGLPPDTFGRKALW